MVILGILCLLIGYLVGISILATIGWILIVIGLVLLVLGWSGHPVGGRTWY